MTLDIGNGKKDASDFPPQPDTISKPSPAGQEIAMLLSLQKGEWQELRSTSGVVFRLINTIEPISGRYALLILIGSQNDDVTGIDATLDVAINGVSVDEIVATIARGIVATQDGINATPENVAEKAKE